MSEGGRVFFFFGTHECSREEKSMVTIYGDTSDESVERILPA
jgi:hypothetical protein